MKFPAILTFLAIAATAACDQSSPPAGSARQPIAVRSAEQNQLHKLTDLDRAIALKRAIYASGFTCKRVESSGYVEEYKNLSMWTAHCADQRDWAIFVGPDGSAQVRLCADVVEAGLPACTKSGPARPGA